MELVDITDLKSVGCNGRGGSSPPARTNCSSGGMVDTQVLGTCAVRRESSSLSSSTKIRVPFP